MERVGEKNKSLKSVTPFLGNIEINQIGALPVSCQPSIIPRPIMSAFVNAFIIVVTPMQNGYLFVYHQ